MGQLHAGRLLDALVHTHGFADEGPVVARDWPVKTDDECCVSKWAGTSLDDLKRSGYYPDYVFAPRHGDWPPKDPWDLLDETVRASYLKRGRPFDHFDHTPRAFVNVVPEYSTDPQATDYILPLLIRENQGLVILEKWDNGAGPDSHRVLIKLAGADILVVGNSREEVICLALLALRGQSLNEEAYADWEFYTPSLTH